MADPTIERDIYLHGRTAEGQETIDLPITRLANLEDGADVKTQPTGEDYFPVIDAAAKNKMKKFPASAILDPLKKAQEDASKALETIVGVVNTISTVPSQAGTLTYNGENQQPNWNNYSAEQLDLGGVTEAKNAGTYDATFTPKGDYTWEGGSKDAKTVQWTIQRATIEVPVQSNTLTYTGDAQSPTWNNYDAEKCDMAGDTTGTDAATYNATFTPKDNFQWPDGTFALRTVQWTIYRKRLAAEPSQDGALTYTGETISPKWKNYDASQLTIGGQTSGINAATYQATFVPKDNYAWSDGTFASKTVNWTIAKAPGSLTLKPTTLSLGASTPTGTITVTRAGNGAITAKSGTNTVASVKVDGEKVQVTALSTGKSTVTVSVAAGTNHLAPAAATCQVNVTMASKTLNDNTWATIKTISDAGQAGNYWKAGDKKTIVLNGKVGGTTFTSLSIEAFILGINHNAAKEGSNRIHFAIGKINDKMVGLCDSSYNNYSSDAGAFTMNTSNTSAGGWNGSHMRSTILGSGSAPTSAPANTLMAALPVDLRAVMKSVTKYTDNTGNANNTAAAVTATTDYLWLLSEFEFQGTRSYANQYEQAQQLQYDYFKSGNSKAINKHNAPTTAAWVWCRSPDYGISHNFCEVYTDGSASSGDARYSSALLPGFAV